LADLPLAPQPVAVIGNIVVLQRLERDHHDLIGGFGFQLSKLSFQQRLGLEIENTCVIDNAPAQRRECLRQGKRAGEDKCKRCNECGERCEMASAAPLIARSFTSPLEGEVGSRSDPGGGYNFGSVVRSRTPLPDPPPQGGRE
jgi:hypothetical protein